MGRARQPVVSTESSFDSRNGGAILGLRVVNRGDQCPMVPVMIATSRSPHLTLRYQLSISSRGWPIQVTPRLSYAGQWGEDRVEVSLDPVGNSPNLVHNKDTWGV